MRARHPQSVNLATPVATILLAALAVSGGCDAQHTSAVADAAAPAPDALPDRGPGGDAGPDAAPDAHLPDAAPDATLPDAAPDAHLPDAAPDARPPDAVPEPDAGPPACDPPLAITPAAAHARVFDLVTLRAAGGTGAWRFELLRDESGALLNEITGAYLAGERVGTRDEIRLTDDGCLGEARATVQVVPDMVVRPARVEVQRGTGFTFAVEGGSGDVGFALAGNGSGGALAADGTYAAGPAPGRDVARVTDAGTGQVVDVVIEVVEEARLRPRPPRVFLPVGARSPLRVDGGSSVFDVEVDGAGVRYEQGALIAEAPGRATLHLTDVFTGLRAEVTAEAVASLRFPAERHGEVSNATVALGPGDLDGDGFADAILGHNEADVAAVNSGAVYVYRGGPGGLDPAPAQVISGDERRDELGRALALGDFDGDGTRDLAVGVWLADVGGTDTGAVRLYRGVPGGLFEDEPYQVLAGRFASDQLGHALVVCDFNGDGRLDLAVGAIRAEDRTAQPVVSNQGAVMIYLGYADGFLTQPDVVVHGLVPEGGGRWAGRPELQLGSALAAGDFDGDGLCDLVAGAWRYSEPTSLGGAVMVYRGRAPDELGPGGVEPLPALVWAGTDAESPNAQLGRRLAVADLDDDGRADIVASHYAWHRGATSDVGAVRILGGRPLGGPAEVVLTEYDADWSVEGDGANDQAGWEVAVGDFTGDGRPDVIAGHWNDEVPGGVANTGTVAVYAGRAGGWPATEPTVVFPGVAGSDRYGEAVAFLGDADGDGRGDLLVFANRADDLGEDLGRPYFVPGAAEASAVPLDLPGVPAGHRFGNAVAVVGDVTGDGHPDVVVGAPHAAWPNANGARAGLAWLYAGTADGPAPDPALALNGFTGHSGSDLFGHDITRIGDFDGDDLADFAISARTDEAPASYGAAYAPDGDCPPRASNGGAVYVFRGNQAGLPAPTPAYVWFAPVANANVHLVAGGADVDGDGLDDLVAGGYQWDGAAGTDTGGVAVITGRPPDPQGRIRVVCAPALTLVGANAQDRLGIDVTMIGDLDGDGCAELAIGADLESPGGVSRQGAVRVIFGWGGPRCPAAPQMVVLTVAQANANAGAALAAGDVDGDGRPDLVVGVPGQQRDRQTVGGAYVVPATYLLSLPRQPVDGPPVPHPLAPEAASWLVTGEVANERAGAAVAVVGGLIAVGGINGDVGGVPLAGGVRLYRGGRSGLERDPVAIVVGETWRPGSRLGELLDGGDGLLIVGGWDGSGVALDTGSAYVIRP